MPIPFIAPALKLITSPLGRAVIVFSAGAALAGFGAWSYQGARLDALHSQHAAAADRAKALQTRERLRAVEQSIADNITTEAIYDQLQAKLRNAQAALADPARADRRRAAVDGLLQQTCGRASGESVQPEPAKKRTDAVPAGWQPERWLPSF